ncbi:MAG: hypothetical protein WKG03_00015 [Telluria sp.]
MIEYQIVNVMPRLIDGNLFSISFTALAVDGELRESTHFNTPASLPERVRPYTDADFLELAGRIAYSTQLYTDLSAKIEAKRVAMLLPPPAAPAPIDRNDTASQQAALVQSVDEIIGTITDKYTRFMMAYTAREAAAIAYKASDYTIDPTELITRFADNVKVSYPTATAIILGQADKLRKAVVDLDNLRMDKYLVERAASLDLARAQYDRIVRAANEIARTLQ